VPAWPKQQDIAISNKELLKSSKQPQDRVTSLERKEKKKKKTNKQTISK